ncbi:MAG TPA: acetate--CoA ligase family protein [Woeseiaceae bacterium]|nr:acetate--CoA ligase family protein [Woeseiaceae bacterium]
MHRLDALLRPRSVAVVGASARRDSMGAWALANLEKGGFAGPVYPVNPGYGELDGRRCYPSVAALPDVPDLVIFAVGDARIEAALEDAIAAGVPAAVLMSSLSLDDDEPPRLAERVRARVRDAGMLVCGANGMGYYNVRDGVWACGFDSTDHPPPGNVAILSHSGSGMSGIIDCEARLAISFAVSTGNEVSVSMDEYLDFVLDMPETRVVGLFVETARNPEGFRAALAKAVRKRIPIVALKTGRTDAAAHLTVSHSGAMAGDDATYDALFERYGVQRARDQDEWTTMLILFAAMNPVGPGGLVTLHDSGGERQLMVDLADAAGVPLATLAPATVTALAELLPPELPAVNPLDAWSRGGEGAPEYMAQCFARLLADPGAALGAVVHDRAPGGTVYESYLRYLATAHAATAKPVALVAARQGTGHDPAVVSSTHAGMPVLDGVWSFLGGVRALFAYRDFLARAPSEPPATDRRTADTWRQQLRAASAPLGEADSLALLEHFGVRTSRPVPVSSAEAAALAARQLGYPVALKSAQPGLAHKTERGGVILGLAEESQLLAAYERLSAALGSAVLVAPMVAAGVELLLGARQDPQFGPVVLLGFGGVLAETLKDVTFALPPFSAADARRYLDGLKLRPLFDGVRGQPAADIGAACELAARFSVLVHELADAIDEIDVNPVIVTPEAAIAVDALVVPAAARRG